MTRANDELNEFGKQTLEPLRPTPPLDPQVASEAKKAFLLQGENLRKAINLQPGEEVAWQVIKKHDIFWMLRQKPVMKSLVTLLLVFVFILASSSVTVYASQSSLPGQPLYAVKSWSEDVRLSLSSSPNAKLSLTLNLTNRRLEEISVLLAGGKKVNSQTTDRFQRELEDALQLAAQLDDIQMQHALGDIKSQAEKQGLSIQELIRKLPPQANPAMLKLQERLEEQVQLSSVGETNPKEFRVQVQERRQKEKGTKHQTDTGQSQSTPEDSAATPMPTQEGKNHGNDMNQPTDEPDHGGPGNGNHGPNPTHIPKP